MVLAATPVVADLKSCSRQKSGRSVVKNETEGRGCLDQQELCMNVLRVLTTAEWPLCLAEAWGSCLGSRVAIVVCKRYERDRVREKEKMEGFEDEEGRKMEQSTRVTNSGERRTDGRQRDDELQLSGSTLIYVTDGLGGGQWARVRDFTYRSGWSGGLERHRNALIVFRCL